MRTNPGTFPRVHSADDEQSSMLSEHSSYLQPTDHSRKVKSEKRPADIAAQNFSF